MPRIDQQKEEQPECDRKQHVEARAPQPRDERKPHQPEGYRDHAHVQPDQRERRELLRFRRRRPDRNRYLVLERGAGRRHHLDQVRFALDPRIRDVEPRPPQMPESRAVLAGRERPVRIIDRDLRDGDGIRTIVEDRQPNALRSQDGALDDEPFDRRHAFLLHDAGSAGTHQQEQQAGEQNERKDREHPDAGDWCAFGHRLRYHGAPPWLRTGPSIRARRTRSDGRGT